MKAALVQQDIIWADPAANRARLDTLLAGVRADLIVLPEMFSTGFVTHPEGIAEDCPCGTLQWMKETASEKGAAVAGSIAVCDGGRYCNRFYFVKPDGSAISYDKRHLFTFGGEDRTFTAGGSRVIVEWNGVRFLLLVCYDLRFPVWNRNRKDYDVILCVASWPTVRRAAWEALSRARAIENQCYVVSVDRTGDDPYCSYNGGTALYDPEGRVVASCADGMEQVLLTDIDMDALEAFRRRFPVLDDADKFEVL